MHESHTLKQLDQTAEHLDQIEDLVRNLLALDEERLNLERRHLDALDTQNLLTWMQLQQNTEGEAAPSLMGIVRKRLWL